MDHIDRQEMGARLRTARKALQWTLDQVAERAGMSTAHLSKAERGQIALSYEKVVALAKVLGMSLERLFGAPGDDAPEVTAAGRMVVTRSGHGVAYSTDFYFYGMLANEFDGKKMTPMFGRASAHSTGDYAHYVQHAGEEFVLVLKGQLKLQFQDGRAEVLDVGDSIYFDSGVAHLYLSQSEQDAEFLVVCVE